MIFFCWDLSAEIFKPRKDFLSLFLSIFLLSAQTQAELYGAL